MFRDWLAQAKRDARRFVRWAKRPRVRRRAFRLVGGIGLINTLSVIIVFGYILWIGGFNSPTLRAPILALYQQDGAIFAEVAACGDDRVRSFIIEHTGGPAAGTVWAIVPATAEAAKPTTIRLFELPAGWQLSTMHGDLTGETTLEATGDFLVWIRTDGDNQAAFAFPRSRLDQTGPDTLLTSAGRSRKDGEPDSTVMSRQQFEDRARQYCANPD